MSLHKKPASVLTHGGHSEVAMASTLETRAAHHDNEHPHLFAGTGGVQDIPERHMGYALTVEPGSVPEENDDYYPRHVHHPTEDEHRVVVDAADHQTALEAGWLDMPAEKVAKG